MDLLRSVILGIVQGLTEFLPISSSAHLAIVPQLLGWEDPGAAYTAVVQIGTELAVILYFWRDIWTIGSGWVRGVFNAEARQAPEWRMGWFIIVGSLPIVVLGLALEDAIDREFRNLWFIASMLIGMGLVLGLAERLGRKTKPIADLRSRDAILLGLAQACALVPGVSRSGATISMGLFLGYERQAATRYAFLLAIPAVVGAGVYKLKDIPGGENAYGTVPTIVGTAVAFVVGLAVIHWLLQYVSNHSYKPFVIYRVALGALVLGLLWAGVITGAVAG
ncbi:undecaprenyl-diphosphate phosphatase [Aeromicrobium sp. 636]|uniref:Undecaprenyl-diphosphatase n=1 Tax=Aeromicrobium senzhongii TaxID=2663859 RepID=A0A8I0ET90_9ACTN|nr:MULTISPECIES: undecaprenyl-diphosphate phosphatase [Aeromicrobium]MBC9224998.1 undecaprenyl-diphosphate phosphatase [Aeromicrobium senzhongii]MCQ3997109.1 undecaprenyl-diphosphate phosphatase [Aeromicrobium sp. 636]MTB87043.1 undecaprenyl-diphosphate phosphatase [Aeromicrobium senzhongii]QNL93137.1 undecaprenyl-diphosphate phosphatase [Aeromicrobium senzhongii]